MWRVLFLIITTAFSWCLTAFAASSSCEQLLTQPVIWQKYDSVMLLRSTRKDQKFLCLSVAISPRVLLTAAHCLAGIDSTAAFVSSPFELKANTGLAISRVVVHPGYDPKTSLYADDLALAILEDDLPSGVRIIPLYDGEPTALKKGERVERIGLGNDGESGQGLRWTDPLIDAVSDGGKTVELSDVFAYPGDSGGPIIVRSPEGLRLLAIHSTYDPDIARATAPVLKARLAWIRAATQP